MATKAKEKYSAYVVYYKRNGQKTGKLALTRDDARWIKNNVVINKRKYLGTRKVELTPLV